MEQPEGIDYRNPDDRWQILYGISSFEDYVDRHVVKGRFNPLVPVDVKEAFLSAEYMMAYAYNHYPLYDEASSKILRIVEMAVKFRCKDLGIDTEVFNARWQRVTQRTLSDLMKDIVQIEPSKDLEQSFASARYLRNSMMHPVRHSYSGALSRNYIRHSVNLLNRLFIPDDYFRICGDQLKTINATLSGFATGLVTLNLKDGVSPFHDLKIESAARVDNNWYYLLTASPVIFPDTAKHLSEHHYMMPLLLQIKSLEISADQIALVDINNKDWTIEKTNDVFINSVYENYVSACQAADVNDQHLYQHHVSNEIGKADNDFWYNRLSQVS